MIYALFMNGIEHSRTEDLAALATAAKRWLDQDPASDPYIVIVGVCPKCGKDTWASTDRDWGAVFECPHCGLVTLPEDY